MFVKDNNGGPHCSLFLLRSTWAIALAVDISSVLYSCKVTLGLFLPRALKFGWQAVTGEDTDPTCTWSSSKADKLSCKPYMAPNLSRSFNRNSLANGDYGEEGSDRKSLGTMSALPANKRHGVGDYHRSAEDDLNPDADPVDQHRETGGRLAQVYGRS